ncbi:biliverdin-producing heme oxygenase [Caldimonas tepidiphila]|uniref:biliverdin-producing heme oxygenase n=1 Tax=Caldimonas tepidiphila TaxID=2315841 RepID=UPI000E5A97F2|nr:biliverdin-producing heme oxygenase [Caldimonas tepidiphila]
MSFSSLPERLKQETHEAHRQVEDLLRLDGPLTRERYAEILRGFAAFLLPWERQMAAGLPASWRPFFEARRRAARLAQDLRALGEDPSLPPAPVRLPRTDTLARALGSLYVIEGSTLGARIIGPRLQAGLGVTPQAGGSYFAGHGEHTGTMWRDFRQALAELPPGPAWDEAAEAARQTFAGLIGVFSGKAVAG